jgi:hypothetical protein
MKDRALTCRFAGKKASHPFRRASGVIQPFAQLDACADRPELLSRIIFIGRSIMTSEA